MFYILGHSAKLLNQQMQLLIINEETLDVRPKLDSVKTLDHLLYIEASEGIQYIFRESQREKG